MSGLRYAIVPLAFLALAGCSTAHEARRAQRGVEGVASGDQTGRPESAEPGMKLAEQVAFALELRPSMESARLDVQDSRLALKEIDSNAPLASATPWSAFTLSGDVGHSEVSRSAHFDKLKKKTDGNASAAFSLDVLLWDFGRNATKARAQSERVLAAELALADTGYSIFKEVATAYFACLENYSLLEVAYTNRIMRAEHLSRAEESLASGESQRLDVLRARLDLAEAEEDVVAAKNDVATAQAKLAAALGLEASHPCKFAAQPPLDCAVRVFADTTATSEELYSFARTNAPNMQIARARLRAASHDVDAAITELMPSISASLSLNWSDPLWYWRWGFSAAQNLFNGFSNLTAVDRAVVAMDKQAAAVEMAELELSLSIALAVAERDNAREAFITAEASVASAKENYETVSAQYSVGDASRVDFADAVANYATALASRVKAFYRGQLAEAALFALCGLEPEYVENDKSD